MGLEKRMGLMHPHVLGGDHHASCTLPMVLFQTTSSDPVTLATKFMSEYHCPRVSVCPHSTLSLNFVISEG